MTDSERRTMKVVALTIAVFTWTLTTHGKYSASGDEPHYLMMAHSIVTDHDLDLANNYANNDGRLFGHDHLLAERHLVRTRQGTLEGFGDVGLPILIAPVYVVARAVASAAPAPTLARFRMDRGLFTYSIVSVTLIVLTSFSMALLAVTVASAARAPSVILLVTAAALSPPIVSHAFLVFPEVVALAVTCGVVSFASMPPHPHDRARWFSLIAALGLLPWVHRKYSFFVLGLLFLLVWMRRDVLERLSPRDRAVAAALFVLPQLAFHAFTLHRWGTIGGPPALEGVPLSFGTLRHGLAGLWLDRQSGVLAYAPIYWLLPVCWVVTWRRTWPYLVPAVLLYLPAAAFLEWWGGFSPAARYLVPIMPLCLVPMAYAFEHRFIRYTAGLLLLPQLAIDLVVWQHPRALWPAANGVNPALAYLGELGHAYARLLPTFR
ncbi:MAG TPA: hypothetical protein VGJ29_14675 [Vicinamibacterales bacterium]